MVSRAPALPDHPMVDTTSPPLDVGSSRSPEVVNTSFNPGSHLHSMWNHSPFIQPSSQTSPTAGQQQLTPSSMQRRFQTPPPSVSSAEPQINNSATFGYPSLGAESKSEGGGGEASPSANPSRQQQLEAGPRPSPPLEHQLPHFDKVPPPATTADSFMSGIGFSSAAAAYSAVCSAGRKLPPPEGNNESSTGGATQIGASPESSPYFQPVQPAAASGPGHGAHQSSPLIPQELISHVDPQPTAAAATAASSAVHCPSASTPYPYFTSPTSDLTAPFYGSCNSNGLLSSKQYSQRRQKGGRSHAGKPSQRKG